MDRKIACLLAVLLIAFSGTAYCANAHMASYRLSPQSPRQGQDFDLYLTFKNDVEYSVDNLMIYLGCPGAFACQNTSITLPPYGVQEVRLPVKSSAGAGIYPINVSFSDSSSRFNYNEANGSMSSEIIQYSTTVIVDVKGREFSDFAATSELFANEKTNFTISFNASGLHNVQVSLYSSCVSFEKPLFYFQEMEGNETLSSPAFVNCREGNADVIFTLASDELSYAVPISTHVSARPHADLSATFDSSNHPLGKDYVLVTLENTGAVAEKLSVAVLPNSAINSADVVYVGDFEGQKALVFQVEGKKAGAYPVEIEARWTEGKESFVKTFDSQAKFVDRGLGIIPIAVIICALALLAWILIRK